MCAIYKKRFTKSQQATRSRKLVPQPEIPSDGIERKLLSDGHMREKCLTHEARQERREELYARSGSHCEGCGVVIYLDTFHLHHFRGRGRGRCDCMQCVQALCGDVTLADGSRRIGCHNLQHLTIDESGCFDSEKSTRLGKPFKRNSL